MTETKSTIAGERTHELEPQEKTVLNAMFPPSMTQKQTALPGFEPNQAGLEAFNSIHNRKAFNLYADRNESWYVVYMPLHGIHPDYGYGSETDRLVRLAIQKGRAQMNEPATPTKQAMEAIMAVHKAFGAPGDYGYGTKQGDALLALYQAHDALANTACVCEHEPR